jgi:hypothetical protein
MSRTGRVARDLDAFLALVTAVSSGSNLIDRSSLESVLKDVRASADGFNRLIFQRVVHMTSENASISLAADSFTIWHLQVCVGSMCCFPRVDVAARAGDVTVDSPWLLQMLLVMVALIHFDSRSRIERRVALVGRMVSTCQNAVDLYVDTCVDAHDVFRTYCPADHSDDSAPVDSPTAS